MINASFVKIDLPPKDNYHFCDSCGDPLTECIRISSGTGITEGDIQEYCWECANELVDEVKLQITKKVN